MRQTPNPQGKGLIPVVQKLCAGIPQQPLQPKNIIQVATELFTTLFVLESTFKFEPVPGKNYHLFFRAGKFILTLFSPAEWGSFPIGRPIGVCVLQDDATWTVSLEPAAAADAEFIPILEAKWGAFMNRLAEAEKVEEALPFYIEDFRFEQRVLAFGAARSLEVSLKKSGAYGLSFRQAAALISAPDAARQPRLAAGLAGPPAVEARVSSAD